MITINCTLLLTLTFGVPEIYHLGDRITFSISRVSFSPLLLAGTIHLLCVIPFSLPHRNGAIRRPDAIPGEHRSGHPPLQNHHHPSTGPPPTPHQEPVFPRRKAESPRHSPPDVEARRCGPLEAPGGGRRRPRVGGRVLCQDARGGVVAFAGGGSRQRRSAWIRGRTVL